MPELPEVETVVRTLRPRVVGQLIYGVELLRTDVLTPPGVDIVAHLTGRTVTAVDRRGKRIVFTLDDGNRFYIHLGMTGQLTAQPADSPSKTHTHFILSLQSGQVCFRDPRRFGGIWWLGVDGSADHRMGPEPLTLRPAALAKRLAGTRRAVKVALLDQQVVAGLGNIYVDEALFAAGIHPLTPASELSERQIAVLNRAIKFTLRRAIEHRGSTLRDYRDADGEAGGFQSRHKVYDRKGEPCRACKRKIERIVLGGRSTHFCPTCQLPGISADRPK